MLKLLRTWFTLLALSALLVAPRTVQACPAWSDAIAESSGAEDEPSNFPAAMNQSIYLMVGVPYLLLGGVGFMIYRGVKKNAEYARGRDQSPPDAG